MKNVLLKVPLVIYSPKGFLCYIQQTCRQKLAAANTAKANRGLTRNSLQVAASIQFLNIALQQDDKIPLLARKMDALQERLTVAEEEIKAVEGQLAAVERKLDEPSADISYLRDKEKQLREVKRLILELILRQSPGK